MTQLPRISIVVPSLNQGKFIGETFQSLLDQQYPSLELIVMDGGSTDTTTATIRKYEKHIAYWESVKDNGQSHAINKGLARSTGALFNWLNSDDLLATGALHELGNLALAHPSSKLFTGKTRIFEGEKTVQMSGRIIYDNTETTIGFAQLNQPAMFYRKEVFEKTGPLNEQLHMCMDLDLWLRFLLVYGITPITTSEKTWAHFRHHGQSKSVSAQDAFDVEKKIIFSNLFGGFGIPADPSVLPAPDNRLSYPAPQGIDVARCYNYFLLWQADACSLSGKQEKAKTCFRKIRFLKLDAAQKRRYLAVGRRLLSGKGK